MDVAHNAMRRKSLIGRGRNGARQNKKNDRQPRHDCLSHDFARPPERQKLELISGSLELTEFALSIDAASDAAGQSVGSCPWLDRKPSRTGFASDLSAQVLVFFWGRNS